MPATSDQFLKTGYVYRSLKNRIQSGALASGFRLVLRDIAQAHETSELPVREAIRMLERDGLVESAPHRGAWVAKLTLEEVEEAFFIRGNLESLATARAVENMTPKALGAIADALAALDAAVEEGDGIVYADVNRRFHNAIYEACPYRKLHGLIDGLWDGQTRLNTIFFLRPLRMRAAQEEHKHILEAIKAGDAERAATLTLEHKLTASRVLIEALREVQRFTESTSISTSATSTKTSSSKGGSRHG